MEDKGKERRIGYLEEHMREQGEVRELAVHFFLVTGGDVSFPVLRLELEWDGIWTIISIIRPCIIQWHYSAPATQLIKSTTFILFFSF